MIHKATTTIPLPSFNNIVTSKMSLVTILSIFLLSLPIISAAPSTAYEVLESYNLPVGLLPLGVTGYTLDEQTGRFEVNVPQPCSYRRGNVMLTYYISPSSGVISNNKITNVMGLSVRIALLGVGVEEVRREGGRLILYGFNGTALPFFLNVREFRESVQCGKM